MDCPVVTNIPMKIIVTRRCDIHGSIQPLLDLASRHGCGPVQADMPQWVFGVDLCVEDGSLYFQITFDTADAFAMSQLFYSTGATSPASKPYWLWSCGVFQELSAQMHFCGPQGVEHM